MANKNDLVVLGLVFEQDRYGYEIIQEVKKRDFEHWANINPASIYNHLKRLEAAGALSSRTEKVGNSPERKIYSITEGGRRLLSELVVTAIASPSHTNHAIACLGIGFVYCADEQAVLQAIQNKLTAIEHVSEHLSKENEELREHIPLNWLILIESAIAHVKVEKGILNKLKGAIESGALTKSIERVLASEGS
jgi:DNA-binding PadR family transcriptional regulator